jgi:cation diffusion facilitator CzcD-associated flavoprotein CzcO
MELDVWTASTATKASHDSKTGIWTVTVMSRRVNPDGTQTETERIFNVKHLVFATGLVPAIPKFPTYPGMDQFKGDMVHAFKFKTGADYKGKKVTSIIYGGVSSDTFAGGRHRRRYFW